MQKVSRRRARVASLVVLGLVAALLAPAAVSSPAFAAATFTDVPESHPFFAEIEWLVAEDITTGFPDGNFRPGADITRQAMAAFLFRYEAPTGFIPPGTPTFSDVPLTHPFYDEIEWLAQSGITTGFPDGTFRPGANITRQAIAAFLFRLQGADGFIPPVTATFTDVPTAHPFYDEIEWLVDTEITTGFPDDTFRPGANVTRQAIAAFFFRYDEKFGGDDVLPPDPSTIAPPIDGTIEPTLADTTSFLYTGTNPIQKDVDPGTIDPELAAVARGRVLDTEGAPLPGVAVTVAGHDEYGSTVTRADGGYDLTVNADEHVNIRFEEAGYPPVQRLARVERGRWTALDDVVMTPYDTASTEIEADAGDPQVHRATMSDDDDGERQATLLFPASTGAEMVMPDGSTEPLDTMTVRATEYTVGERGPDAMPGDLPSNSEYTYAVEFSIDEAVDAGAASVEFDQPVVNYVENFIGFPVGTAVPTASYNAATGAWEGHPDGIVIGIVAEAGGAATVDLDGDGDAEPNAELDAFGIDADERTELAELYAPGDELWRVLIPHFSPYDHNWSQRCSSGNCSGPGGNGPNSNSPTNNACQRGGSVITCQDQVLGENVAIVGTPFSLVYSSDRVPGRTAGQTIEIPLTNDAPPDGLVRVEAIIDVAGQHHELDFGPEANQTTTFTWDGRDAYGRRLPSTQEAVVQVVYVYEGEYIGEPFDGDVLSWSQPSDGLTGGYDRTTSEFRSGTIATVQLDNRDLSGAGLGGWTLDAHHRYDVQSGQLLLGDGTTRDLSNQLDRYIAEPVAGDGTFCASSGCGDGGPALAAQVSAEGLAVGPDGLLYFYDSSTGTIRRVNADGTIESVYGSGLLCVANPASGCGTGGELDDLQFGNGGVTAMAFGPDGTLYFTDGQSGGGEFGEGFAPVIRAIRDGLVELVAGDGEECTLGTYPSCGDGGDPADSSLVEASDLAVTPDGTLYVLDGTAIRRVLGGIISHAYGCVDLLCTDAPDVNGGPAAFARMLPTNLEAGPDGSLFITDLNGNNVRSVRRIDPDGVITRVAGSSPSNSCRTPEECGDGLAALIAQVNTMSSLAVDTEGGVWVGDTYHADVGQFSSVFRRFTPGGTIDRYAGNGRSCPPPYEPGDCGDFGPARQASMYSPLGSVARGVDGDFYVYDFEKNVIRHIVPREELYVPSDDGQSVFVFDRHGRHLATRDAITGIPIFTFGYDGAGRLITIADRDGNVTTVARDAAGTPTAIEAPFGQDTSVVIDGTGFIGSITDPGGHVHGAAYGAGGLMSTFTDPAGNVSAFTHDTLGRLILDTNAAGGSVTLVRTETTDGFSVEVTTAEGRTTTYEVESDAQTGDVIRRRTDPAGATTTTTRKPTGDLNIVYPDGRVIDTSYVDDPRFGASLRFMEHYVEQAPGGLTLNYDVTRDITLDDPLDPWSVTSYVETGTRNGDTLTFDWNPTVLTGTWTTAEGSLHTQEIDAEGHLVAMQPDPTVTPATFTYDAQGRLLTKTADARITTYTYDARSRLLTSTDPTGDTTTYGYDDHDHLTSVTTPGGDVWTYAYDANGNLATATMPDGEVHTLGYDEVDAPTSWTGPGQPAETRTRNLDEDVTAVTLPDGADIARGYDSGGRIASETTADATSTFGYVGVTDLVGSASWDPSGSGDTQSTTFAYAGILPTSIGFGGPATGTVTATWNNDMRVSGLNLSSGSDNITLAVTQDDDGWMTGMGPFTHTRGGPAGATTEIADGTGTQTMGYDQYADWNQRTVEVGATTVYDVALTRDLDGRVTGKVETTPNGTTTSAYTYDDDGRIDSATLDGAATDFAYDGNGNPTSGPSGAAVYDNLDRATSVDGVAYTYNGGGFLTGRGADTFDYSAAGELLTATVGGETVTYAYDALGRRTARTDSGGTTQYLYGNPINPLQMTASRAADGVLSTYLYDDWGHLYAMLQGGERFYVGTDQVGTPVVVADDTGTVVRQLTYDAWGNIVDDTGPAFALAIGFAGGIADPVTGLVRFGKRDYDPASGRWTARDPSLFEGDGNLYTYAVDDPQNRTDPSGLFCIGGSFYEGLGGGGEYCVDRTGISICGEFGVGVGGGYTLSNGGTSRTSAGTTAEISGKCGGFGAGVAYSASVDECGNAKTDTCGNVSAGGLKGKYCLSGNSGMSWSPPSLSCNAAAKIYNKVCLHS